MAINKKSENQNNIISSQIANMQSMEKRVKKLTTRLWAGIFLLFIMLLSGILLFYYEQLALALTGNYTMTSGDLLTAGDWNTLSDDFVDKSGDTMNGNLNVTGNIDATGSITGTGNVKGNQICIGNTCKSSWPINTLQQGSCYWTGGSSCSQSCPSGYYVAGVELGPWAGCGSGSLSPKVYCCQS